MIKPHFEYCSSVLYLCRDSVLCRLQRIQNRAMRIILKCNRYTPIRSMLNILLWLNVKQRIVVNVMCFIFKIKHNLVPSYLRKYLRYVRDSQPYSLRNRDDFRLPNYLDNITQDSIVYKGCQLFNTMPSAIKNECNYSRFKRSTVEYIKCQFPHI